MADGLRQILINQPSVFRTGGQIIYIPMCQFQMNVTGGSDGNQVRILDGIGPKMFRQHTPGSCQITTFQSDCFWIHPAGEQIANQITLPMIAFDATGADHTPLTAQPGENPISDK